jgi:ribonuclease BN (tRNA processing enzyme)
MKITILGCGSFMHDLEHLGPSYLVRISNQNILLDAGCGSIVQLFKSGLSFYDLDAIFITHIHNDHTSDLVAMLIPYIRFAGPNKILKIYGPKGVARFIEDLITIYGHKKLLDEGPMNIEVSEINSKVDLSNGSTVEPFSVEHLGLNAFAYRLEENNKIFVFSGDSNKCKGIEEAIQNADLFIADSSLPKGSPDFHVHLTTEQIGEISQRNQVKKVVLSHLMPKYFDRDLVSEVRAKYEGEIVLAKDLMQFEL